MLRENWTISLLCHVCIQLQLKFGCLTHNLVVQQKKCVSVCIYCFYSYMINNNNNLPQDFPNYESDSV